ncbi:M56 family metallopeptidase [Alteromonas sp. B31-7]|uniref:M56 family metallopeptidase n=1 Tax=Alteromonas sp. B31-7 TaxID=2785913 RepID=UPI0018CA3646|nr:M56 family metallopeptidase [Alteromonas sp. B31-7]QPL50228.1 M48 family metalloprotease [Alteromonas sp. B31-7]|tara:strand:- start:85486 stop:86457 length:972 start_codon:yes stop_codon:yes gene_type:complete
MTNTSFLAHLASWLLLSLLLSWCVAGCWRVARPQRVSFLPDVQVKLLFTLVWLPFICAAFSLIINELPPINRYLVGEHCHESHCGPHDLYIPTSSTLGAGVLAFAIGLLCVTIVMMARQLYLNKRFHQLLQLASASSRANVCNSASGPQADMNQIYQRVDSQVPSAWCAGLLRPQIYVSQGLVEKLSENQLNLVLLHEFNHVRQLDNIKLLCVRYFMLLWPKRWRTAYRHAFINGLELRSDLFALHNMGHHTTLDDLPLCVCQQAGEQGASSERRKQLKRLLTQPQNTLMQYAVIYIFVFVFGMLLTLIAVAVGHPLMEFLLQ